MNTPNPRRLAILPSALRKLPTANRLPLFKGGVWRYNTCYT